MLGASDVSMVSTSESSPWCGIRELRGVGGSSPLPAVVDPPGAPARSVRQQLAVIPITRVRRAMSNACLSRSEGGSWERP